MNRATFLLPGLVLTFLASSLFAQQTISSFIDYGPVKKNETLWSIATRFTAPGESVTETTRKLFKNNPTAFENGNINLLKVGAVLKIPQAIPAPLSQKEPPQQVVSESVSSDQELAPSVQIDTPAAPMLPLIDLTTTDPGTLTDPVKGGSQLSEKTSSTSTTTTRDTEPAKASGDEDSPSLAVTPQTLQPAHHHDEFEILYRYDFAVVHDDNIRRTKWEEDIREDTILDLSFSAGGAFKFSHHTRLSVGARLGAEKYSTFDLLDNVQYALRLKYSFAFSSEFLSPVYALKMDIGGIESESDIRSSDTAGFGLEMNQWLTDSIRVTLGYKFKQREGNTQVFDTQENQLFANLDYEFGRASVVYLTYHLISGDIVSSATPRLAIINIADAIEADDAFGGVSTNQFAYRIDADTQVFTIGLNSGLTRSMSYDLSLRSIDSESTQNPAIYYDRLIFRAGLLGRF